MKLDATKLDLLAQLLGKQGRGVCWLICALDKKVAGYKPGPSHDSEDRVIARSATTIWRDTARPRPLALTRRPNLTPRVNPFCDTICKIPKKCALYYCFAAIFGTNGRVGRSNSQVSHCPLVSFVTIRLYARIAEICTCLGKNGF